MRPPDAVNLARQLRILARIFPPAAGWFESSGVALIVPAGACLAAHWHPLQLPSQHHPARPHFGTAVPVLLLLIVLFLHRP